MRKFRPAAGLMGATALSVALSACKIDNRPLLAWGSPPPADYAGPALGPLDPGAAYLPADQAYVYPQRAYAMSRVVYQRPPSYAFAYGDEQPWVWDVADDGLIFAEPYEDDWRYYYYGPGDAYPYFVQDPHYGYAYGDGGVLLALFTAAGALIAADRYRDYAPRADYYWDHAYDLNRSYWGSPRYRVEEAVWRERAPLVYATHERWFRGFEARPDWREAVRRGDWRHDNGLHLGWYKDRGERRVAREFGYVRAPERFEQVWQERHEQREGGEARGWREERRERAEARPQREPEGGWRREGREARRGGRDDDRGWREARRERPEARPQREPERGGRPEGREARRGGDGDRREARREARSAEGHGREAAWRGEDRPQRQHEDRGRGGEGERRGGGGEGGRGEGKHGEGKHEGKGRGGEGGGHGRGKD